MDVLVLLAAGTATALATGIGAVPVFLLGERVAPWRAALWGLAAGLMAVASVVGLLKPALDDGTVLQVLAGFAAGVAFLFAGEALLRGGGRDIHVRELRGAGVRRSVLIFGVLFVHSLPEGLAIGSAYASGTAGLGLFVILAIGLQNIPEGTSVAIPMQAAGFGGRDQFWAAVATSLPQPVGAVIAFLLVEQVRSVLPLSFAFAAGAMLALVAVEMGPEAFRPGHRVQALAGACAGATLMVVLSVTLGV